MRASRKLAAGKVSTHDVQLCPSSPCLCTPLSCVLLPACLPARLCSLLPCAQELGFEAEPHIEYQA